MDEEHDSVYDLYSSSVCLNKTVNPAIKTCWYLSQDCSFPKAKRDYYFQKHIYRYPNVDPAKYSDSIESSEKKYWYNNSGNFNKDQKISLLEKSIKKNESFPGPGHYNPYDIPPRKKQFSLGTFGKGSKITYLDNIEAISESVPSCLKYVPYSDIRKVYLNRIYHSPYYKPKPQEKNRVGPGAYDPDKSMNSVILKKPFFFKQNKEKKISHFTKYIKNHQFVPGVGSYPGVEKSMSLTSLFEDKKPPINPYKFKRFSQKISEQKQWVPGPGSYNIGPLPKIYSKKGKSQDPKETQDTKPDEDQKNQKDQKDRPKKGKKSKKNKKPKTKTN